MAGRRPERVHILRPEALIRALLAFYMALYCVDVTPTTAAAAYANWYDGAHCSMREQDPVAKIWMPAETCEVESKNFLS